MAGIVPVVAPPMAGTLGTWRDGGGALVVDEAPGEGPIPGGGALNLDEGIPGVSAPAPVGRATGPKGGAFAPAEVPGGASPTVEDPEPGEAAAAEAPAPPDDAALSSEASTTGDSRCLAAGAFPLAPPRVPPTAGLEAGPMRAFRGALSSAILTRVSSRVRFSSSLAMSPIVAGVEGSCCAS